MKEWHFCVSMNREMSVTFDDCKKWREVPSINPLTKRRIAIYGPVYQRLKDKCEALFRVDNHIFRPQTSAEEFAAMYSAIHSKLDEEGVKLITTGEVDRDKVVRLREMVRAMEGYHDMMPFLQQYMAGGERSKFFMTRKKANQLLFIKDTLGDIEPVDVKKSYASTKSVSSSKKSLSSPVPSELSPLPAKTRKELLGDLEKMCSEMLDAITYEEFEGFRKKKLQLVVAIGPDGGKKHCYYVKSLHNLWQDAVQQNKAFRDPLDPSHRVTDREKDEIHKKMRYVDLQYKRPERQIDIDPRLTMKIEEKPDTPNYYHISVTFRLGQVSAFWNLGYIPADIDQDVSGSLDMTSTAMAGKIYQLFNKGRIFKRNFIPIDGNCCRIHLWKPVTFWGSGEERLRKFRTLMEEIDRAM